MPNHLGNAKTSTEHALTLMEQAFKDLDAYRHVCAYSNVDRAERLLNRVGKVVVQLQGIKVSLDHG